MKKKGLNFLMQVAIDGPASANLVIVSTSFEAGPKVLTILVFFILKKSPIIQNQKLLG